MHIFCFTFRGDAYCKYWYKLSLWALMRHSSYTMVERASLWSLNPLEYILIQKAERKRGFAIIWMRIRRWSKKNYLLYFFIQRAAAFLFDGLRKFRMHTAELLQAAERIRSAGVIQIGFFLVSTWLKGFPVYRPNSPRLRGRNWTMTFNI